MLLGRSHTIRVPWSTLVATALASVTVLIAVGVASATPGAQLWAKRYNGPGDQEDYAQAVGVSPDGTKVFVTGYSIGSTSERDYATVAYDASTGAKLWAKRYNGPGNYVDTAGAVEVSPDGSMAFVTGASYGIDTRADIATIAYDTATGTALWVKRFDGPRNRSDGASDLGVSPDGSTVFVTGASMRTNNNYVTLAYEATTGSRLWVKRYDGPANSSDVAHALGVSSNGSKVFITGSSFGAGADFATLAYDASTGEELWVSRYDGPSDSSDTANALDVSPDGSAVFVTGWSTPANNDYATVAYDASSGTKLWARLYDGPGNSGDQARDVGVSPDGSTVFVTGGSAGTTTSTDFATIAYDASSGSRRWLRRFDGTPHEGDEATALGVSPNGSKVFVTGFSYEGGSPDYATVAYDAVEGTRLWAKRHNDPGGFAEALAVSPNGSAVFVTGEGGDDYTTVAYGA